LLSGADQGFGIFDHSPYDKHHEAVRIGKRAAGRVLDGRTWNEMPETGQRLQRQAESDPASDFDTSTTWIPHQSEVNP
jgi:hypothetical protein